LVLANVANARFAKNFLANLPDNDNVNVNVNVNVNDNVNVNVNLSSSSSPPSLFQKKMMTKRLYLFKQQNTKPKSICPLTITLS